MREADHKGFLDRVKKMILGAEVDEGDKPMGNNMTLVVIAVDSDRAMIASLINKETMNQTIGALGHMQELLEQEVESDLPSLEEIAKATRDILELITELKENKVRH